MERNVHVFDNEKFISLIQLKECLWNTAHVDYSNRNKKQEAWVDVCKAMEENFDELTSVQKNDCAKDLQKKWKSLRNSFTRELAKRKTLKSGSAATWKTYIFFDQLSFLMRCPSHKQTTSSLPLLDTEQTDDLSLQEEDVSASSSLREPYHKKSKLSKRDNDTQIAELLKESIARREVSEKILDKDDDRHFLLSLLGDFKKIPEERKMDVKIGIIQTIRAAILPTQPYFGPQTNFNYSSLNTNYINSEMISANIPQHPYMLQPSHPHFSTRAQPNTPTAVTLHKAPVTRSDPSFNNTISISQPEPSPRSSLCSPQSYNSDSIIDIFTKFNPESEDCN